MNKPIILDNAVLRTGDDMKVFEYDYSRDLNIVYCNNTSIPFINMKGYPNELVTKTKVDRESDDDEIYCCDELYTKTEVDREKDDETNSLLELETKTFIERERDDEESFNFN